MRRFRNLLVVQSGSRGDAGARVWARRIAGVARSERVQVFLVDPDPADWVPEYPVVGDQVPGKERVEAAADEVAAVFAGLGGLELQTKAAVGAALPTVLQELADGQCDLVVVGVDGEEDRRLAEKLARKGPASVLSVPVDSRDRCELILTAVDFSAPSARALEVAVAFGRAFGAGRLGCLHTFRPVTRPGTGAVSAEGLREATWKTVSERLADFLEGAVPAFLPVDPIVRESGLASSGVIEELAVRPYDLVVMATRGRSSLVRALLGSNTADVIRRSPVPVLAVKAKGEGLGFLRELLESREGSPSEPDALP